MLPILPPVSMQENKLKSGKIKVKQGASIMAQQCDLGNPSGCQFKSWILHFQQLPGNEPGKVDTDDLSAQTPAAVWEI